MIIQLEYFSKQSMRIVTLVISFMLVLPACAYAQGGAKLVSICKGTTLRLKAESSGANKYQWHKNNVVIAGSTGKELIVSEEGSYTVLALNATNCMSDLSVSVDLTFNRPVAVDDIAAVSSEQDLLLDVLLNDQSLCAALDTATLVIKRFPAHGTIVRSYGKFKFRGQTGYGGNDTFTYTVKDASGQETNAATVTIALSPPLPVTLISFSAVKDGLTSFLSWATSMELNSDHFEIQRSTDAKSWSRLGDVLAAVVSNVKNNYDFTDENPESGLNYYRLKMVDRDGSFAYSQIKSVHFPEFVWAKLFPNPVSDVLNVVVSNKRVRKIRLIDSYGRVMYAGQTNLSAIKIDMKSFAHGMYFIHLEQEDGVVRVFKVAHQ